MKLLVFVFAFGFGLSSMAQFDRPNFVCATSPNAAQMYIEANIFTDYYSKTVRVRLEHVSTYRRELILNSLNERPVVHTSTQISLRTNEQTSNEPFPGGNSLNMDLVKVGGRRWKASIEIPKNVFDPNGKVRKFEMDCIKK